MRLRLIAYIIALFAVGLTAFNIFWKPEDYSAVIATCRNDQSKPEAIIQACSELIGVAGISDYNLNLFLRNRAWAFNKNDDYETALADIDRAIKVMPESDITWVWRAFINNAHGDYDATAEDFERALAINPDRAVTFKNRANLFYHREKYEQALQDYQRVLIINPKHKLARERVVTILLKRGKIDQAIAVLNRAIALSPDDPEIYRRLGVLHLKYSGDYEESLKALLRSDELDPNNQDTLIWLGAAYMKLGDKKLGKAYVEKYVTIAEQNIISEMNLFRRATYKLGILIVYNGNARDVYRGIAYSFIGYPNMARPEFKLFLKEGGPIAFGILRQFIQKEGFCRNPCPFKGEGGEFYEELDKYIVSMGFSFKGVVQSEDR